VRRTLALASAVLAPHRVVLIGIAGLVNYFAPATGLER
jgi:hypothetical protein